MKLLDIADELHEHTDHGFPLGKGRVRIAAELALERRAVPGDRVRLLLDDSPIGTAADFSIDEHGALHAHVRLEKRLQLDQFWCEPIWESGRMIEIRVRRRARLVDDQTGYVLIDDETGARIYND